MKKFLNGFSAVSEEEMIMVNGGEGSLNTKLRLDDFKFEEKDGFSFSAGSTYADINYKKENKSVSAGITFSGGPSSNSGIEFGNGSLVKISGAGGSFNVNSMRLSIGFSY